MSLGSGEAQQRLGGDRCIRTTTLRRDLAATGERETGQRRAPAGKLQPRRPRFDHEHRLVEPCTAVTSGPGRVGGAPLRPPSAFALKRQQKIARTGDQGVLPVVPAKGRQGRLDLRRAPVAFGERGGTGDPDLGRRFKMARGHCRRHGPVEQLSPIFGHHAAVVHAELDRALGQVAAQ